MMKRKRISLVGFLVGLVFGWALRIEKENITKFLEENFMAIVFAVIVLALLKIDWRIELSGGFLLGFGIGFSL